jgi:hypothetical protein
MRAQMRLYLISDEQLKNIMDGQAHERENAFTEVSTQQEVTTQTCLKALNSAEAAMSKGGAE